MDMSFIIIAFMAMAGLICLFTVITIIVEMIGNRKARKTGTPSQPQTPAPEQGNGVWMDADTFAELLRARVEAPALVEASAPAPEEPELAEPETASEDAEEEHEDGIWIAAKPVATLEEKYLALDRDAQNRYDEIVRYAMQQAGVKRFKTAKQEVYKVGQYRIVKLSIRRGIVMCEFLIVNNAMPTGEGVTLKQAPTTLKVDSDSALDVALRTIDLAMEAAEADRKRKRDEKNARRRQARAEAEAADKTEK